MFEISFHIPKTFIADEAKLVIASKAKQLACFLPLFKKHFS